MSQKNESSTCNRDSIPWHITEAHGDDTQGSFSLSGMSPCHGNTNHPLDDSPPCGSPLGFTFPPVLQCAVGLCLTSDIAERSNLGEGTFTYSPLRQARDHSVRDMSLLARREGIFNESPLRQYIPSAGAGQFKEDIPIQNHKEGLSTDAPHCQDQGPEGGKQYAGDNPRVTNTIGSIQVLPQRQIQQRSAVPGHSLGHDVPQGTQTKWTYINSPVWQGHNLQSKCPGSSDEGIPLQTQREGAYSNTQVTQCVSSRLGDSLEDIPLHMNKEGSSNDSPLRQCHSSTGTDYSEGEIPPHTEAIPPQNHTEGIPPLPHKEGTFTLPTYFQCSACKSTLCSITFSSLPRRAVVKTHR